MRIAPPKHLHPSPRLNVILDVWGEHGPKPRYVISIHDNIANKYSSLLTTTQRTKAFWIYNSICTLLDHNTQMITTEYQEEIDTLRTTVTNNQIHIAALHSTINTLQSDNAILQDDLDKYRNE